MRAQPLTRSLPVLLALAALLAGGCLGRTPAPRFYALSPMQEEEGFSRRKSPTPHAVIGIGPVRLADYLDNSRIVTRTGDNRLVKAEYDRWAGSFKNNVSNVLAENIGGLQGTDRIFLYPWRTSVTLDYQVVVDIIRLDGRLGEAAWLVARWSILAGPEKKLLKMDRADLREPVSGPDYADLVAAQSRALASLSRAIAQGLASAPQNAGAGEKPR